MKMLFYVFILLLTVSFTTNAQSNTVQQKQKYNFMLRMHLNQNIHDANKNSKLKINPYWQDVEAPPGDELPGSYYIIAQSGGKIATLKFMKE